VGEKKEEREAVRFHALPVAEEHRGNRILQRKSRRRCDSSITCKLGILFVSVKYVLVSVKLVYAYVKLLKI
jgi:hypothetical protein